MSKIPRFISPSALDVWLTNEEEYYLKYLSEDRPPRIPQNKAMSVGSSFDAYVKASIGKQLGLSGFEFDKLFEKQVEVHNRDFALKAGADCFRQYRDNGALEQLMCLLRKADRIEMEFKVDNIDPETGRIIGEINGVPMLGIPDLKFVMGGITIIHDWKVNGYTSRHGKSPTQGYLNCIPGMKQHKDCHPTFVGDLCYNLIPNVEQMEPSWARQICVYAWLVGESVGGSFICSVDQLCCKIGTVVTAQHRCQITKDFQQETLNYYKKLWERINSGHFFRDMEHKDSIDRCLMLDQQAKVFNGTSEKHEWLKRSIRG